MTVLYAESIALLEDLYRLPFVPTQQAGLDRAARLLRELGNPHLAFRSVHVAGTSGKGSTTSMIGAMLRAGGLRVGMFRSPHLHDYRERIVVDGDDIMAPAWERAFGQVWPVVERMRDNRLAGYELGRPALFEVLFALMALHFASEGVEWSAVETGLGGRLDATNLLPSDVAVITNVSLEHTQVLGNTVAEIAREKAAIIKPGVEAIAGVMSEEALKVVRERALDVNAPLTHVGTHVRFSVRCESLTGQSLTLESADERLEVELPLAGAFQASNAAAAYAAVSALRKKGLPLSYGSVVDGLRSVQVPGRLELLSRSPAVLVDGAHNPQAARELALALRRLQGTSRVVLLFAAMADKDVAAMAAELGPIARHVVITSVPDTERGADPHMIARAFDPYVPSLQVQEDTGMALETALGQLGDGDILLITGSLYLVGQARRALRREAVTP